MLRLCLTTIYKGRNVIIFGVDMSLSVQIDNDNDILIFGEGPTQG